MAQEIVALEFGSDVSFSYHPDKPHIWMTYNGEIYNYKRLGKQFKFDYQTGK